MGFYIDTGDTRLKAHWILENIEGARQITLDEANLIVQGEDEAVIVIVYNPTFEAAGFAYSTRELRRFDPRPDDLRPRDYLAIPFDEALKRTHFPPKHDPEYAMLRA